MNAISPRNLLPKWVVCLAWLLLLGGCKVPAQMVWSPDGKQAVWRNETRAMLIGELGAKGEELGDSTGGFAWSSDSRSLYYVVSEPGDVERTISPVVDVTGQAPTTAPAATEPASQPAEGMRIQTLSVLTGGKISSITSFYARGVWHMHLSPDGNWLAIMSFTGNGGEDRCLFAYSIPAKRLLLVSRDPGMGACFTGPNELAYVESIGDKPEEKLFGHLVQVRLDESATELKRKVILDVMPILTPWMWPDADRGKLLFTAAPVSFPSKPQKLEDGLHKLYHLTLGDAGMSAVTDDIGPMFMPSPDGKRVLIEKITPATDSRPAKRELAVINVNGSNLQPLRDVSAFDGHLPMWPSWRGNDQIAFIGEESRNVTVGTEPRTVYDVVLYQIPEGGKLSPARTLSESWTDDMRPARKSEANSKPGSTTNPN